MIIAADATTYAGKVAEKIAAEINQRLLFLRSGQGIDDFAKYKHEVGYIAALDTALDLMTEAAKELSDPQSKKEAA